MKNTSLRISGLLYVISMSGASIAHGQTPGWPTEVVFEPSEVFSVHSTELRPIAIVKDYFGTVLSGIPLTWTVETGTCTVSSPGVVRTGNRFFGNCSIAVRPTNAIVQGPGRLTIYEVPPSPTPPQTIPPTPDYSNVIELEVTPALSQVDLRTLRTQLIVRPVGPGRATVSPVPITYTSTSIWYCPVDANGLVTFEFPFGGSCSVTARSPNGKWVMASFNYPNVTPTPTPPVIPSNVASIEVSPATSSLDVNQTLQLTARVLDRKRNVLNIPVSWETPDYRYCRVDRTTGLLRVISRFPNYDPYNPNPPPPGECRIYAREPNNMVGLARVVVPADPPLRPAPPPNPTSPPAPTNTPTTTPAPPPTTSPGGGSVRSIDTEVLSFGRN
jgi:hypothetical protein